MSDAAKAYWDILNDIEDLAKGGVRRHHAALEVRDITATEVNAPPRDSRPAALTLLADEINSCRKCQLCEKRTNTVPGVGVLDPLIMFIGEGPGADEDRTGVPFVGRAGQYLDKWIEAIGLERGTHCFIGNVVKCRPPGNRDPEQKEMDSCLPYLHKQIGLIRPRVIVTLGRISSQVLCHSSVGIGKLRGGTYDYLGIPIVPTYHPSGVLRNPEFRAAVWEDLKRVRALIENGD